MADDLRPEDSLRLNVLLAQNPGAIRIDESRMTVHALTERGEARVELNPDCDERIYLRRVKAALSTHAMGTPGGYPVFLERWTRMGQARDQALEKLLLLGESEAVVAVVHAPGLDARLAELAWWAMPDAPNARAMLRHATVAASPFGRELAAFLLEFLPFEENPADMLESVRLVLQPGLIDDSTREKLWRQADSRRAMLVGFLLGAPDSLPLERPPHPALAACRQLAELKPEDSELELLARVLDSAGQGFVTTCARALRHLPDQEVSVALFDAIRDYFTAARVTRDGFDDIEALQAAIDGCARPRPDGFEEYVDSLRFLAAITVELLNPVFARTDSVGSGMRRKLEPISERLFLHLERLGAPPADAAERRGRSRGARRGSR